MGGSSSRSLGADQDGVGAGAGAGAGGAGLLSILELTDAVYCGVIQKIRSGDCLSYTRHLAATPTGPLEKKCWVCKGRNVRHAEPCNELTICEICCDCWSAWGYPSRLANAIGGRSDCEGGDNDGHCEGYSPTMRYLSLVDDAFKAADPALREARPAAKGIRRVIVVPSLVLPPESRSNTHELDRRSVVAVHVVPLQYDGGETRMCVCTECGPGSLPRVAYLCAASQRHTEPDAAIAAVALAAEHCQCMHGEAVHRALSAGTVLVSASVFLIGKTVFSICAVACGVWAVCGEHSDKSVSVTTYYSERFASKQLRCSRCSGNHRHVCTHMLCVGRWLEAHAAVSKIEFEEKYFRDYSAIDEDEGDNDDDDGAPSRFLPALASQLAPPFRETLRLSAVGINKLPDIFIPAATVR